MPKQIFAKEYEDYLITGKEEALNTLPSGSIEKEYFTLIRRLLKEEITPELQKEIDNFVNRIPEDQSYRLKALNIFKKLKKNPEKKHEIIQDIKKLFNLGNVKTHNKPVKYNKPSSNQKDENESQKLPNSLNINTYIQINKFIEGIYSGEINPTDENNLSRNNNFNLLDYLLFYRLFFGSSFDSVNIIQNGGDDSSFFSFNKSLTIIGSTDYSNNNSKSNFNSQISI